MGYTYSGGVWAGGIAGEITGGGVFSCSSILNLKLEVSPGYSSVGGLLGGMDGVEISDSFFSGAVEGKRAGGILGAFETFFSTNPNTISHCYSTGTVTGVYPSGQAVAGGIAGIFDGNVSGSSITASYSSAAVECRGGTASYAGGIAGWINSTNAGITGCLALNEEVTGTGSSDTVRRVVADTVSGPLSGNSGRAGMRLTYNTATSPISQLPNPNPAGLDGADTLADPPSQTEFYTSLTENDWKNTFAMAPSHWNYPYPVFQWQIDKGIRP
jgi:hypothetical protein